MKRFAKYSLSFAATVIAGLVLVAVCVPYNRNGYLRIYGRKAGMLSRQDRTPAVVLFGGSSVAFGYDSELVERTTGMPVINSGTHVGIGLKYMIDDCFPRLKRGDILVFSPEYIFFFDDHAYGEAALTDVLFLDNFRNAALLNRKQWRSVAENLPNLLHEKLKYAAINASGIPSDPVYKLSGFNTHGDVVAHWKLHDKQYVGYPAPQTLGRLNESICHYMKTHLDRLRRRGITIVVYPAVISATAYQNSRPDILLTDSMFRSIGYPCVCPVSDVVRPDTSFYDTSHHLKHAGAIWHSKHLSAIIETVRGRKRPPAAVPLTGRPRAGTGAQ